ncbi:hypothetical protein AAG570_013508 [Ranatra chinensis]|uniref:U6 snRNA phosphodiesterase 1 n=1 Tax=Ranatra chinensis TaxID=642074 RepID=A0ABD0YE92_9HEMI
MQRLPLPEQFQSIPKRQIDDYVEDDPDKHEGRLRSFPHERGNWVSFVYIPYKESYDSDLLCDLITDFYLPKLKMRRCEEPHVSLTKTFILMHHWIDQFILSVKSSVKMLPRFQLTFDTIKVYQNEEKNRTFLGLKVNLGNKELLNSLEVLREPFRDYKLDAFYQDPCFHMSIVWCPGDVKCQIEETLPILREKVNEFVKNRGGRNNLCTIFVDYYICKTGYKMYKLQLD